VGVTPEALLQELEGLRALARSLVHGDADVDDLIQDTAIAALARPPAADARPLRAWLGAVLRNRWRMDRRSASRRQAREHAVAIASADGDTVDPTAGIGRARALEKLAGALVALDEPFRTTVIRRYFDGRSAAELARELGVPAGTVRWRLKTGLARLRAALDDTSPRWQRAFMPFLGVAVKTKTSTVVVLVVLILIALLGGLWFAHSRNTAPPVASGPASRAAAPTAAVAPRAAPTAAAPEVREPLPGQGRPAVAASDAVGGVIDGRVINWSTGDGVAGAELTFTSDAGAATIRSRDDGGFQLAPQAPGRFTLTAIASPGFLPYAPELLHSTVRVALAAGQTVRGITVFLFPALDYRGRVVDAHGAPVSGARVRLLGTPAGEQVIDKLETEWTTDRDGRFAFHAADDAVFEATRGAARGWARLDNNVQITRQLTIALGDAPPRDATITGHTVDGTGAAIGDVLVRASPGVSGPVAAGTDTRATAFAMSGPDGAFTLRGLDRDAYDLAAETEDRAPAALAAVPSGSRDINLTLDAGLPLAGTVVDGAGTAVPAFTLLVFRRDGAERHLVVARSLVEPHGRFDVRVTKGDYELLASAQGWAPSESTHASAGTTDLKLALSTGGTLRGVVVSAADQKPVQYARVVREARGGGASVQPANAGTVTRADGTFELTGIPPGPLSISIAAGGFNPRIEAAMTASDGATIGPITIALTPLAEGEEPKVELVGIGAALSADGDALRVNRVFPGSGAEAAGIVVGDHLTAVDGLPVGPLGLEGAIAKIRGVVGTTVALTVRRGDQTLQLVVERRKIKA
jgi:RNA polymerase sigma factor (sigma-70 family)